MDNAEAYQETSFTSNGYPEMVQRARGKEIVREASKGRSVQYENEALPCYGYTNSKDMERLLLQKIYPQLLLLQELPSSS
jgi:hypothetical protein